MPNAHSKLTFHFVLLLDNTHTIWYKDAGLRRNVAFGLGLCLVIATNVNKLFRLLATHEIIETNRHPQGCQ